MRGTESCPDTAECRAVDETDHGVIKLACRMSTGNQWSHAVPTFVQQHGRLEENMLLYW